MVKLTNIIGIAALFLSSGCSYFSYLKKPHIDSYENPKMRVILKGTDGQYYIRIDALSMPVKRKIYSIDLKLDEKKISENKLKHYGPYLSNSLERMYDITKKVKVDIKDLENIIFNIKSGSITMLTKKQISDHLVVMGDDGEFHFNENTRDLLIWILDSRLKYLRNGIDSLCKMNKDVGYKPFDFLGRSDAWVHESSLISALKNFYNEGQIRYMLRQDHAKTTIMIRNLVEECNCYEEGN